MERINISLTKKQKELIVKSAKECGLSITAFILTKSLGHDLFEQTKAETRPQFNDNPNDCILEYSKQGLKPVKIANLLNIAGFKYKGRLYSKFIVSKILKEKEVC